MKLEFDSVEEVLAFVDRLRPASIPRVLQPGNIDPQELARSLAEVGKGHKIQAIKIYRAVTGGYLKESKDAVERFWPRAF